MRHCVSTCLPSTLESRVLHVRGVGENHSPTRVSPYGTGKIKTLVNGVKPLLPI
jgi:hypothetical protein